MCLRVQAIKAQVAATKRDVKKVNKALAKKVAGAKKLTVPLCCVCM